jgi:hypothetical protein
LGVPICSVERGSRRGLLSAAPGMFCCSFCSGHALLRRTLGVNCRSFCSRHTSVLATTAEYSFSSFPPPLYRGRRRGHNGCALFSSPCAFCQRGCLTPAKANITLRLFRPLLHLQFLPGSQLSQPVLALECQSRGAHLWLRHGLLRARGYWRGGCAG